MPNPWDNPELYDTIILGNTISPGTVRITGHDNVTDWDVKVANGQAGAAMTRKGRAPVEFTCTFYLVNDVAEGVDDFLGWEIFQGIVDSTTSGKAPKALDIYHPDLAANGIKSVVKKSVGGLVHDGKGGASVVVKFIEYFPPKKAGGSPRGSKQKPDPNAAQKKELEDLIDQYKKTPWG